MINIDAVGVLILNDKGTLLDCNDAFLKMCGYGREEMGAGILSWRTFTPPEWVEASTRQWEKLEATGRIGPYEKEIVCRDGSRLWIVFAGANLGDGTVAEYCMDVSDRKRTEQELRDAKDYAELIIGALHEPLLVLSPELLVRSANQTFYQHFGLDSVDTLRPGDLRSRQRNVGRACFAQTARERLARERDHPRF